MNSGHLPEWPASLASSSSSPPCRITHSSPKQLSMVQTTLRYPIVSQCPQGSWLWFHPHICHKIMSRFSTSDFNCLWHCPAIPLYFNSQNFLMDSSKISLLPQFHLFFPSSLFPCHHLIPDSSNGLLVDDLYVWSFSFLSIYPAKAYPANLSETSCSYITSLF